MPDLTRVAVPAAALAALLALTGCGPGSAGPDTTTDDTADHDTAEDPFAPEPPTTGAGWVERYHDIPWLSDDLDNDDFLVTGTVDGHPVMGIYCNLDGSGSGSVLSTDSDAVMVHLQTATDIDILVDRGPQSAYTGIGTYQLPAEPQGTHPITPSLSVSIQVDGPLDKASPSTAEIALELLGVPYPDTSTCARERDELDAWAFAAGGHAFH